MSQNFKTIGSARYFAITVWFVVVIVVSNFNSPVMAGITLLITTVILVSFYSGTKAQIMGQAAADKSQQPQIIPSQDDSEKSHSVGQSVVPPETLPSSLTSSPGLIKCPDCNHEVSRRAASCPNCGCPIRTVVDSSSTRPTMPSSRAASDINIPQCPTCHSTDVTKISLANKAGKVALVGVFAIGKVSKTFKCNACGYDW